MIDIYGIKNCNTVKKALDWLNENNKAYTFHDFKKEGVSAEKLTEWSQKVNWEQLVNKKGTTWKQLEDARKAEVTNIDAAFILMQEKTSVIKRPVIETNGKVLLGFDEEMYSKSL